VEKINVFEVEIILLILLTDVFSGKDNSKEEDFS
jgi:hypothetical protein